MTALLRLCRPHYALPLSLGYLCILLYARGGTLGGDGAGAAVTWAALLLVIAAAYALNDAVDVAVDRWNAPERPVAAGRVRRGTAVALAAALLAAGLALGARGRPPFGLVLAGVAAGLVAYDLASKRLGAAKQPFAAALVVSLYPLAAAQAGGFHGPRAGTLLVFPVWLFLSAHAYEVLKDLRDLAGDARVGATPLARRPAAWRRVASAGTLAGIPVALAPLAMGCGPVYLAVAAPGLLAAAASPWLGLRRAIQALYAEVLLVALAAALDVIAAG